MWPLFLIGGVVIVGGWLWGASKVVSKSPPLAHDPPVSPGITDPRVVGFIQDPTIQNSQGFHVGDLVEVNAVQGSSDLFLTQMGLKVGSTVMLDPVLMRVVKVGFDDAGNDLQGGVMAFFENASSRPQAIPVPLNKLIKVRA
jgi:hypothetical protein